jgi:hypothetical protein
MVLGKPIAVPAVCDSESADSDCPKAFKVPVSKEDVMQGSET